jgi:NADPH:quinone reductase-like Zn-dependent oxidoreductase
MPDRTSVEMRTLITDDGLLRLWLEEMTVLPPEADEVVVRVEAAPLNPSDQLLLLGPVDPASLRESGTPERPVIEGRIPGERLAAIAGRFNRPLPVGSEGAGTIVEAGRAAEALLGRTVAIRATTGTYAQYQTVKAADCLLLPSGMAARDGAAAFINPLTALGIVETMQREGHSALVHTAAASNLGQMLNRLCLLDGVPLVNIVRSATQVELLRAQGAVHVLDASAPDFEDVLLEALDRTGATLAFDAIGGGTMASRILAAMEKVASRRLTSYSRYGASVHKQVYIYGVLDPAPRILDGQFGMAWGIGGWLMTWFYEKISAAEAARLRQRAGDELATTFASHFTEGTGLAETLSIDVIRGFSRRATGAKSLILPHKAVA